MHRTGDQSVAAEYIAYALIREWPGKVDEWGKGTRSQLLVSNPVNMLYTLDFEP